MIKIKKNPNRKKEDLKDAQIGCCGHRCDKCLLNIVNNGEMAGRLEFQELDYKCYHYPPEEKGDYSNVICDGCGGKRSVHKNCEIIKCCREKGWKLY